MKKTFIIIIITGSMISLLAGCPGSKTEESVKQISANNWQVPVEVADTPNSSQTDYYTLGWQTFIAINWPTDLSVRGMPDTTKKIGATDNNGKVLKVVWESWKEQYEIFLPLGKNPGPWQNKNSSAGSFKVLRMFSKNDTSRVLDAFDEATGSPLIDQDSQFVRYEVRTNQTEYTYYLTNSYYDADSQIVAISQNRFNGFPHGNDPLTQSMPRWAQFGATEVKASWRVFKPNTSKDIKNRYYHQHALLIDQYGKLTDTVEIGLLGLHILRLTPSTGATWYWASFEQVDNLKLQPQYGGTVPAHPTFNTNPAKDFGDSGYSYQPPIIQYSQKLPPAIPVSISSPPFLQSNSVLDSLNLYYSNLLKGTPFQYYQLIGTVNPPIIGQPSSTDSLTNYPSVTVNTPWLANSTMETYINNSNCVTCHIAGFPKMPSGRENSDSFQVFTFLPSMAKSSSGNGLRPIKFLKINK